MSDNGGKSLISEEIGDVSAVGVFVNRQMILKVMPLTSFEESFKDAYKDFKSECLVFLREVEEKDDLLVRHYDIGSLTYTMFYCEVGDKESVYVMKGKHKHGYTATETLHMAIDGLILSLSDTNPNGNNNNKKSLKPGRRASRRLSAIGFSSIEEVFRTMDLEGTGAIDEAEFATGLEILGLNWKSGQIHKLFSQIDDDRRGQITFDAFMRFMQKGSNKKSWKELKKAINSSIAIPTVKSIQQSNMSADKYMKKLSQMEKLANMMEEAMVEQQLTNDEQLFWRNKIIAHREFIRRHQDVVGRAMGQENSRLKKRLNQMERRVSEQVGGDSNSKQQKNRKGSRSGRLSIQGNQKTQEDFDNQALIKRLRRENQEFKRKIQSQQQEIRKANTSKARAGSVTPRSSSRRGSGLNLEPSQMEEMLGKLKKENYELRTERNEIRKHRDEIKIQLQSAKDRLQTMGALAGDDEQLLKQLAQARRDAKGYRKDKRELEANFMEMVGLNDGLKRKLLRLAKRVQSHNPEMSARLVSKKTANGMIDELASQLILMIDSVEALEKENERLKRELRDQLKRHENALRDMKDEIANLRRMLKDAKLKNSEIKQLIINKNDEIEEYKERLLEMDEMQQEMKNQRRKIAQLEDEINEFHHERESVQRELSEAKMRAKNYRKQLLMLEKMPGNASMLKKIERLYKIFQRLDEDDDGYLRFDDFQRGAADLGFGESREEQEQEFNAMDQDGDGMIDFEAFKDACLRQMEASKDKSDAEWKLTFTLLSKPPSKWKNEDVNMWLQHIGMNDKYGDNFENVDGNMLINMKNAKDLRNMGVQKNAHIRKIQREIKDLKARDDLLSNMRYENETMKDEISNLKSHGPTWQAVHLLQRKVRDLDGKLRKEKFKRENIMISVKDELKNDDRFDNLSPDYEDVLAEVALLKGALADSNQQLKNKKKGKQPMSGSEYENMSSPPEQMKNYGKPIGRFLQKWYVLANHSTQYWISRTNEELDKRDAHFKTLKENDDNYNNEDMDEEEKNRMMEDDPLYTESIDWIFFDTRQQRVISEVRMRNRGAPNDAKDVKLQMSVSPSGPWTTVIENELGNHDERQRIGGFEAQARFWRVVFMSNYGEKSPNAPRYVLYECQFWGPTDDDVDNNHFVIE